MQVIRPDKRKGGVLEFDTTVLGAADLYLMLRYSRHGLAQADSEAAEPDGPSGTPEPVLTY